LKNFKELLGKLKGVNVKIAGISRETREYMSKTGEERMEISEEWFPTDLSSALSGPISLTQGGKEDTSLTPKDMLRVILDTADTLMKIEEAGYVHRDIKEDNILIKKEDDDSIAGYVTDFDLLKKIGDFGGGGTSGYQDVCSSMGVIIPANDSYALMMTLGKAIFGQEFVGFQDYKFDILEDIYGDLLLKFVENLNDYSERDPDTYKDKEKFVTDILSDLKKQLFEEDKELEDNIAHIKVYLKYYQLSRKRLRIEDKVLSFLKTNNKFRLELKKAKTASAREQWFKEFYKEFPELETSMSTFRKQCQEIYDLL